MKGKPVKSISRDGGIRVYASAYEAATAVGGFQTNITAAILGRRKSCCGYRWAYADERDMVLYRRRTVVTSPRPRRTDSDIVPDCMPWPKCMQEAYPELYALRTKGRGGNRHGTKRI